MESVPNMSSNLSAAERPRLFTASQWQELERQASIFKFLKAGVPVPRDLLTSIIFPSFLSQQNLGYCSYYGKRIDPEPGRCRRTDGKKWRCSKDACPDSKYCERHMNKGRIRSRKPVELQNTSQSLPAVASNIATGSSSGPGSFQPTLLSHNSQALSFGSNLPQMEMEPTPYEVYAKECRFLYGLKPEAEMNNGEALEGLGHRGATKNTKESTWNFVTSQIPSHSLTEPISDDFLQYDYPQLQVLQDIEPPTMSDAMPKQQHQHCTFGRDYSSVSYTKKEVQQSLEPYLEGWPRSLDFGSHVDEQKSNKLPSITTKLSISTPMAGCKYNMSSHPQRDA
ncbi:hypothetical protein HS088_TW04G00686 [Tripterygium wilfordii]|uniref:Growth-regulating factor n=1 Tax=Tripterygium wilfordii TaxID=458696 RepID=A0A7J7DQT4_TRIWF|nr:growth-regulating factor 4-like isoform X2 [Tripterygium wilfordii]KAF5748728.1 hypothetical protein HS088_TW04G00686 [Tripterygium wilfordii]